MSKILVTGAAGFIGSQLSYALWKKGEEVVLLDNFSYGKEDNLIFPEIDFRDTILKMDIKDEEAINELFEKEKFDVVYHIAAITPLPDCQYKPKLAIDTNVGGTVNILEAARKVGVKKVIFSSTSAVYENSNEFPSKEDKVSTPSLIYSGGKFAAENFCRSYAEVYGMNIVVLRFANVYGPHIDCLRKTPPVAGYLIKQYFNNESPVLHSTGDQERDFVYVDDLIRLAILVQQGEGFDVVNVSTNETHSINSMSRIIAKIMGKEDIKEEYAPVAHFWEKYPELYSGAYKISEKILSNEVNKYTLLDNSHAKERYGWVPEVDFEEGLRRTVEFSVPLLEKAAKEN